MNSRFLSLILTPAIFLIIATQLQAAVITVDTNLDGAASPALCQLRDAIQAANTDTAVDGCAAGSGNDIIQFSISNTTIMLESDLPAITSNLEINGPGKSQLTISGAGAYLPVFALSAFPLLSSVAIRNLTLIQGRNASDGGCISLTLPFADVLLEDLLLDSCQSELTGGGMYVESDSLHINRVWINANQAVLAGGGAALFANDTLVEASLISSNSTSGSSSRGGGLRVFSGLSYVVQRTTFWDNTAVAVGAAIDILGAGTSFRLQHSTLAENTISGNSQFSDGGTISVAGTLTLFNTVIANNQELNPNIVAGDISPIFEGSVITEGFNFIGNNEGVAAQFPAGVNANGDQAGTNLAPLDPELGALMNNGGPTPSALPAIDSPLVDNGSCPGEIADQRGFRNPATELRPVTINEPPLNDGCDIGAVEYDANDLQNLIFADGFES